MRRKKRGSYRRLLARVGLMTLALGFAVNIYRSDGPYHDFFFGLMAAAALGALGASLLRRAALRIPATLLSAALAALAGLELGALVSMRLEGDPRRFEIVESVRPAPGYNRRLGYGPAVDTGTMRVVKRRPDGGIAYDAVYTFRDGIRATKGDPGGPCTVLFMIDSIAFGEGLNDDETLPARFSEATGFKLNVVNLGFAGYGPHQMLRRLEDGAADRFVRSPVAAAYFVILEHHFWRVRGMTSWNRFDPRYGFDGSGTLRDTGHFHFLPRWTGAWTRLRQDTKGFLRGSAFLLNALGFEYADAGEIAHGERVFVAAVDAVQRNLRSRWNASLTLLQYDETSRLASAARELERSGAKVLRYADLVGSMAPPSPHVISGDDHPTAAANRILGKALADRFSGCR